MKLGIDVGSTTVKLVLLGDENEILYSKYERHMSNVFEKVKELLEDLHKEKGNIIIKPTITLSLIHISLDNPNLICYLIP